MTQEEKARAYDEALERARKMLNMILDNELLGFPDQIREIFPQLKESKDEKIREEMIRYFTEMKEGGSAALPYDDCIAYLEKQKEQKSNVLQNAFDKSKKDYTLEEKSKASDYAESILPTSVMYGESEEEYKLHTIIEAAFIAGQKEQRPAEWEDYKDKVNIPYCSSEPEWSEEDKMPMPEDTVIFQKGVAEGRRLEREDNNKALAEMYGYEGGTESELVKITFTIPKEHFKRLMPIKQGDVFGIENLTNKEVVG